MINLWAICGNLCSAKRFRYIMLFGRWPRNAVARAARWKYDFKNKLFLRAYASLLFLSRRLNLFFVRCPLTVVRRPPRFTAIYVSKKCIISPACRYFSICQPSFTHCFKKEDSPCSRCRFHAAFLTSIKEIQT